MYRTSETGGEIVHLQSPTTPAGQTLTGKYRRNGKLQSCEPCRISKLRCDHVVPYCGRCVKRGRAEQCVYHPGPLTQQVSCNITLNFPLTLGFVCVTTRISSTRTMRRLQLRLCQCSLHSLDRPKMGMDLRGRRHHDTCSLLSLSACTPFQPSLYRYLPEKISPQLFSLSHPLSCLARLHIAPCIRLRPSHYRATSRLTHITVTRYLPAPGPVITSTRIIDSQL